MMTWLRMIGAMFVALKNFFIMWFLPMPAVDSFDSELEDKADSASAASAENPRTPEALSASTNGAMPSVGEDDESNSTEPAPEVKLPESAEERVSRQPGSVNPFV